MDPKTRKEISELRKMLKIVYQNMQYVQRKQEQADVIQVTVVAPTLNAISRYLMDREEREGELKEYLVDSAKAKAKAVLEAKLKVGVEEANTDEWWKHSGLGLTDDDFTQGVVDWQEYYGRIRPDWFRSE